MAGKTFFTNFDGIKGSELLQTFNITYELTGRGWFGLHVGRMQLSIDAITNYGFGLIWVTFPTVFRSSHYFFCYFIVRITIIIICTSPKPSLREGMMIGLSSLPFSL